MYLHYGDIIHDATVMKITLWSGHMFWGCNYITLRTNMAANPEMFMNCSKTLLSICKEGYIKFFQHRLIGNQYKY